MTDPQELINIARQIDPSLSNPQQTLIEALVVARALDLLKQGAGRQHPLETAVATALKKRKSKGRKPRPISEIWVEEEEVKLPRPPELVELMEELREYRKTKGLKMGAISKRLRVSTSSVYHWLAGKWNPSELYQERIRQMLSQTDEVVPIE